MFEKEAEEYAENREVCDLLDAISEDLQNYDYGTVAHYNIDPLVEECFKDGAEFGYNKANEWHYVKDGDLPKDNKDMLISEQLILIIKMKGSDCLSLALGRYNFSTQEFGYQHIVGLTDVIAWKEIVPPNI